MAILHKMPDGRTRPRRKRRRLKSIAVLPSMFTMGNLLFGFAAIHFAARGNLTAACYVIIAGLVCDALDGRIARLTRKTSDFGAQLDSLADIVTFGVAPAIMVICIFGRALDDPHQVSPLSDQILGRAAWIMAAIYVACAGLRLARFNVENSHDESAHLRFKGLPSPAAAATVGSLIMLHEEILRRAGDLAAPFSWPLIYALPPVAALVGLLMVSQIPYVHLANVLFRGRRPFSQVALMTVILIAAWIYPQLVCVVIACGYTFGGLARYLFRKLAPRPEEKNSQLLAAKRLPSPPPKISKKPLDNAYL